MKKIILSLGFFVLALTIWSPKVFAASFNFAGGDGLSAETAYQITTCEQLQEASDVSYLVSEPSYFILNNNIDCSMTNPDSSNWDSEGIWFKGYGFFPIGEVDHPFIGDFNGNGKVISGLYINQPESNYIGLFGLAGAANVYDVGLTDVDITGGYDVGGLVGDITGGQIENTYITGTITGIAGVGGLVGYNNMGQIFNSYSTAKVTGNSEFTGFNGTGGLVGANSDGGHIENTYATGDVIGSIAGGLVGVSEGEGFSATIVNSYAMGNVAGGVAGGLVGLDIIDDIYNSYSTGDITPIPGEWVEENMGGASYIVGGLVGLLVVPEDSTANDYIFNSGWYQSQNNSELSGVGMKGYVGEGLVLQNPADVTYTETNNQAFYSKTHGIYNSDAEHAWSFNGNPWYEQSDTYPKFQEQEESAPSSHSHIRSSGSSPSVIASFQLEQQQRALNAGLTLPTTSNTTSPLSFYRTLKLGMQGDDVKSLQTYLNTHGYDCGTPDGTFGLKTKQAVIAFQLANGLKGDGVVGILTKGKMQ